MALIKCTDCGSEISDKAKQCIKCGCPIEYSTIYKDGVHPTSTEEQERKLDETEQIPNDNLSSKPQREFFSRPAHDSNHQNNLLKIFSFEGRANRFEFIITILGIFIVTQIGATLLTDSPGVISFLLFLILIVAGIIAQIAITIRRLHDINRPGWHILLLLVPLYNLFLLILLLLDSGNGNETTSHVFPNTHVDPNIEQSQAKTVEASQKNMLNNWSQK
jgi:uncharacterized membrane protein YhaH (DUF805 family)